MIAGAGSFTDARESPRRSSMSCEALESTMSCHEPVTRRIDAVERRVRTA